MDIGKPVSFFCKIYANPPCSNVVWKKYEDGQYTTIQIDCKDCSQTENFTSHLKLDTFMESDSGYYLCYATNIVGTSKSKCISLSERTCKLWLMLVTYNCRNYGKHFNMPSLESKFHIIFRSNFMC